MNTRERALVIEAEALREVGKVRLAVLVDDLIVAEAQVREAVKVLTKYAPHVVWAKVLADAVRSPF